MATFFRGAFRQTSQTAPRSALCGARQNIRRKADRMEDHQLQELETRVRVGRGRWGSGERTWGWSGGHAGRGKGRGVERERRGRNGSRRLERRSSKIFASTRSKAQRPEHKLEDQSSAVTSSPTELPKSRRTKEGRKKGRKERRKEGRKKERKKEGKKEACRYSEIQNRILFCTSAFLGPTRFSL